MATGFLVNGKCLADLTTASNYYFSNLPVFTSVHSAEAPDVVYGGSSVSLGDQIVLTVMPRFNAPSLPGVWGMSYQEDDISSGSNILSGFALPYVDVPTFASCPAPEPLVYDYVNGAALWTSGLVFTLLMWLLGKNIGLIFDAVKRF